MKVEEQVKEVAPAVSAKKPPPAQENAAVQPVKAAAVEVSGANGQEGNTGSNKPGSFLLKLMWVLQEQWCCF